MGTAQADESRVLKKLSLSLFSSSFPRSLTSRFTPLSERLHRLLQKEAVKFRPNPDKIDPFYVSQKSTTNRREKKNITDY